MISFETHQICDIWKVVHAYNNIHFWAGEHLLGLAACILVIIKRVLGGANYIAASMYLHLLNNITSYAYILISYVIIYSI